MKDKTYYYKKDIGDSKDVVIVAAHFKNAFRGADQNLATVDGLWQLSDTPKDVSENTEYDKMTIQTVTADSITMDIEDNDITLSKNKDISLMPGVSIKTADADELRYYIYKEATIEGEEEVAEEETAVVTPVNDTEKVVEEAKEAVEEANKTVEEAEQVVGEAKEEVVEAEAKAEEAAEVPANKTPGFGSIFALTGLLAVAYLVLSRRD